MSNNDGKKNLGIRNTIPSMFSQVLRANSSAVGLELEDQKYTYQELDDLSNQLAQFLLSFNLPFESRIAISVNRSAEMIIGLLGILKAGLVYVPIDPNYPEERIKYLLKDSGAEILLTHQEIKSRFSNYFEGKIIGLDKYLYLAPKSNEKIELPKVTESQLAYSIYTSGSTGNPKGVLIEHRSVVNLVQAQQAFVQQEVERFLYAYSFSFDGSVLLIWWTLLTGGTLVMTKEGLEKDINLFADFISNKRITHLLTFPSLYRLILDNVSVNKLSSLKSISVAGESCPGKLVRAHHEALPLVRFFNQYGPTEATVGCTIFETNSNHSHVKTPIGFPIQGTKVYILNDDLNKVGEGTIGEICIGGIGVARGYHNNEKLNESKFVWVDLDGKKDRIYRSGDLGRILPNGSIDFCGRKDTQIKLRGYRIELGEVESAIKNIAVVKEVVVLLSEGDAADQKLIAYCQVKNEKDLTFAKQEIEKFLPSYMLPALWVKVEKFDLTPAGKINRRNLPIPGNERPNLENNYVAPVSQLEIFLKDKWEAALGVHGIGIEDKFFELGGNSLLAAGFIGELQQLFNETIFIVTIFENPTIAEFAAMLSREYAEAVTAHFGVGDESSQTDPKVSTLESEEIKAFIKFIHQRNELPSSIPQNDAAIFILAPPRSGTSLLRTMLSGHPEIFAANELQLLHFSTMQERAKAYEGKFALWKEGLVRAVMELYSCEVLDAKCLIKDWENQNLDTAQVYAMLHDKSQCKFILDKSPSYALDWNALKAAALNFENPKFIQISRHPFAMLDSFDRMHMDQVMFLKDQPYRGKQLAEQIWYHSHKNIQTLFDQIPEEQKFSLQYESLVKNPDSLSKEICEFLNIEFDEEVSKPYENVDKKMMTGIYKDSKPMGDINFLMHGKIKAEYSDAWKGIGNVKLSQLSQELGEQLGYEFPSEEIEELEVEFNKIEKSSLENGDNKVLQDKNEDIAIIGMSVRLPGANDLDKFWDNLIHKTDVSSTFSKEQLLKAGIDPDKIEAGNYVNKGMILEDYDCFDEKFFGYTPKEAALMDPQHRIYLEVAYSALEDAGINTQTTDDVIGIYGGVARNTYLVNNVMTHPKYFESLDDFTLGIALEKDFPASKVAYKLNLKGPAVNVQTACSSSGVALHLACNSLKNNDADVILVGGGRIQPPVDQGYEHTDGHALSPTGFCHTFDAEAKGMVRGQGMAFIVLKKLSKAIEDRDNIRAIIKGSAINNDGSEKIGFTAPASEGQSLAIKKAYLNANVNPQDVSYIEAHGTGTSLGDPIEIAGLTKAFKHWTNKKQYCAIASVKSNVGHLDAGATVLGIIKTALAFQHELLPATMHYSRPNPQIDFVNSPFYVNDALREWPRTNQPRYAGISALGLGGTNAHIVLSEAPLIADSEVEYNKTEIFTISAKSNTALEQYQLKLVNYLDKNHDIDLSSLAYTLNTGRKNYKFRNAFVANDQHTLVEQLKDFIDSNEQKRSPDKFVFMFPGGGAQHQNMGLGLYESQPVFRDEIDLALKLLKENHNHDFREILYPSAHRNRLPIEDPLAGMSLLFITEYATAKLWQSWGIEPSVMIGHSMGEYTAACLAGAFSFSDALKMVVTRAELFETLPKGGMLSIGLPLDEVKILIGDRLDIASINRPDNVVVSGSAVAIDEMKKELNELEIHATRPKIHLASHSREIEPIMDQFKAVLETIEFKKVNKKLICNLKRDWPESHNFLTVEYWLNHLRHTVHFSDGIAQVFNRDENILIEIGPGQTLATFARQHKARQVGQPIFASLPHPKESTPDVDFIYYTLGRIWELGAFQNWTKFYKNKTTRKISLPTYPFARKRHWIEAKPKQHHVEEKLINMSNEKIDTGGAAPGISRQQLLLDKLKGLFNEMSGIPVSEIDERSTFLELGFDSLFLTQAVSKIKKAYEVKLSFRQLFDELPNLGALSKWLDKEVASDYLKQELEELNARSVKPSSGNVKSKEITQSENIEQLPSTFSPPPTQLPQFEQLQNLQNVDGSELSKIIAQQLQLMQQQLWLLGSPKGQQTIKKTDDNSANSQIDDLGKLKALKKEDEISQLKNVVDAAAFREINKSSGQPARRISNWNDLDERETKYLKKLIKDYTNKTKGSQELTQSQRKHLADPRSISGFNAIWKDMIYQIAMVRSEGSKMWDVDGNEYIDYRSSFGISLFGHSPEFIQKAIQDQLAKGFELGALTPLAKKVADLLCELSGMDRITIVNTGSEALSAAVRAARTVTGRDKIAVFEGDYHGIADELLVRSITRNGKSTTVPVAPGIPSSLVQNVIVLHYDDPNVLNIIEQHADELAGILIEPIQPNNPTFQPKELIQNIRKVTAENDIALIFDEMITGFRIAPRGAQEWYNVEVDLVAYGKIISGGLPMAALAGKAKYLDAFDGGQWQFGDDSTPPAGVTFFGGTFVRHPLGLASSLAALTAIKEGGVEIYNSLNQRSEKFANGIAELINKTKAPLKVLATSSIVVIKPTDGNPFTPLFFFFCRMKGIHMNSKAALVTLAHSEEDLNKTLSVFEEVIGEMQTAGFFPITVQNPPPQHQIVSVPNSLNIDTFRKASEEKALVAEIKNVIGEDQILPLTQGQKEVWIEHRLGDDAAAAYNLAGKVQLNGKMDLDLLQAAIDQLAQRHGALRTKFDFETPTQLVQAKVHLPIEFIDCSDLGEDNFGEKIEGIEHEESTKPFDLFNGPLVRFRLIQKNSSEYIFIISAHHGIADGWSCGILAKELSIIYSALIKNESHNLAESKSYVEFVIEENEFLSSEEYSDNKAYWESQFQDDIPVLEFPTESPRPLKKTYNADLRRIHLDQNLVNDLKQVASKEGTTLFILLYTAYRTFLNRLSNQDDFVLGLVAAAQTIAGNENLVTHGVSLLPVRNKVNKTGTFSEELKTTRNLVLDAFDHQHYTLGALVQALNVKRDPSRQPIISFLFNMDADGETLDFGNVKGIVQPIQRKYETFDTFINVKSVAGGIDFEWIFNTDLFGGNMINLRLAEFKTLLTSIVQDSSQSISKLNLMPQDEINLLKSWNSASIPRDKSTTFLSYFQDSVRKYASKTAVRCGIDSRTYLQLEEDSNRLAFRLKNAGIKKGDYVGIYFERSIEMMIAIMASLKLGGIYVPLDPVNPVDRIQFLLNQVDSKFLLTHALLEQKQPVGNWKTIYLNGLKSDWKNAPSENVDEYVQADDLAYIIYTSGSSGKPKSVQIPHHALVDHHLSMIEAINIKEEDHILSVASVAFDPSVQDYFLPLMIGAEVTLATREEQLDGRLLAELINNRKITLMQATPATWRSLSLSGWDGSNLLTILSGGEGLNQTFATKLLSKCKRLYNIYGPTETTIWSTTHEVIANDRKPTLSGFEPVGKPMSNVQLYLLDEELNRVPIGVPGELYIGGVGVAPQGYHKSPELNAFHFVKNPFNHSETIYRTGDLACYQMNGNLEFLGRKDGQVKIRGHRIELGEVESFLSKYKVVKENVVVAKKNPSGEKTLVAYVTLSNGTPLDVNHAKQYLQKDLPGYMVPNFFVTLRSFPLTSTLKVDRKKLPEPNWDLNTEVSIDAKAVSKEEKLLENIWADILNINGCGIHDDFFEIGGHSLIAVEMMARIEEQTGIRLPLSSLLENSTIYQLAQVVKGDKEMEFTKSMVPIRTEGSKPPVYLVHGAGLHVLMYQTLAEHMSPDQPIFGFQARGLYGEAEPLDRIEDMAAAYIEEILERNPDGPYALAGYSFGGLITFEMAKQLKAMGKEVVMLGMFDTVVRPEITGKNWSYYQSLKRLGKKVAWNFGALAKDPIHNIKYKSNTLNRRLKRMTWSLTNKPNADLNENNIDHNMALLDQKNKIAFEHYRITPFDGKIHLFRAKVRRFWIEDFDFLGWRPFAKKGVIVHEVPGDHLHLFDMPNGKEFAQILQSVLNRVFSNTDSSKS